ncbi:MAG: folylpolyglutamate synthase/dihydrofolate synthase family protein [Verrucomicrobiae bacterium]|nr:folylpolyglutamate synthase/dihydrofolate synthase family protein [Verrucomicrobiae bacterium]
MTYAEAQQFLHSLRPFGQVLGLDIMQALADRLGNPERHLRFIHIAGTNGKGSVAAMCHSVLTEAGYRCGLYTSPHLVSFTERFQINRTPCQPQDVVWMVERIQPLRHGLSREPTFFETVTAMALDYFREQRVDIVVWETGMGGRLDATNIVIPLVSVITTIGFDHQQYLGDTLEKIAAEKAGIIKPGIPCVTGVRDPGPLQVIRDIAAARGSPLTIITEPSNDPVPLPGEHQRWNWAVAQAALRASGLSIPADAWQTGLQRTEWPGRFQQIGPVILDGAHNPPAAEALAATWRARLKNQPVLLIIGVLRDKDYRQIVQILAPLAHRVICVPVRNPRSLDPRELAAEFPQATVADCVADALAQRRDGEIAVVTGSLFLVGEALQWLQRKQVDLPELTLQ